MFVHGTIFKTVYGADYITIKQTSVICYNAIVCSTANVWISSLIQNLTLKKKKKKKKNGHYAAVKLRNACN